MDLSTYLSNTSRNVSLASNIPEICKKTECVLGIDEAGRGPVLGPMVYGCCYYPKNRMSDFATMKFADSKTLTEAQREALFETINSEENNKFIGWRLHILAPNYISNSMLAISKYNLNEISHDTAAKLVGDTLNQGVKVTEVFVDTVGPADKYQAKLSAKFPNVKFTVSPKADSKFPSVSAASICCKVARDRALKQWQFVETFSKEQMTKLTPDKFGCGYPSDDTTRKFLNNVFDPIFAFPQIVRFSWSTAGKIIDDKGVEVEWRDDILKADAEKSVKAVFKSTENNHEKSRRCRVLRELYLS